VTERNPEQSCCGGAGYERLPLTAVARSGIFIEGLAARQKACDGTDSTSPLLTRLDRHGAQQSTSSEWERIGEYSMIVQDQDLSSAHWRKSALSAADGNCVEVAFDLKAIVAVRDSKHPGGPVLAVGRSNWGAFVRDVKHGVFDID
jgi:hypothetical protein